MDSRLKLTFVGHVDHGKSTLIGRLLYDTGSVPPDRMAQIRRISQEQGRDTEFAYLMDHLQEEREQGITIDTAQVFFRTPQREYLIIDAPGHRQFLKNMLTGASQAEVAILMLDANEGVCEQTQRHAFLLTLLGIRQCLVAVNKMDTVGFDEARYEALEEEVMSFFGRIGLEAVAFVPLSAKLGDNVVHPSENMPWYYGPTLLDLVEGISPMPQIALPARFCVQDVYNFDGRRIIAGRVETGTLDAEDEVAILPDGGTAEVQSIERFESENTYAEAGECVGLTLPEDCAVRRGHVLCDPEAPATVTDVLNVQVFWMSPEPMHTGGEYELKIVTQDTRCHVESIRQRIDSSSLDVIAEESATLGETEVAEVTLRTDSPVAVDLCERTPSLGRVVLELSGTVVGAGIVVGVACS